MNNIKEISQILSNINDDKEIYQFFSELLTDSEINVLSRRWCILNMLNQGFTQRYIAKDLNVSLCNVTRGAKILKNKNAVVKKYLRKDKTYGNNKQIT